MPTVSDECLDQIFRQAHTHIAWLDRPVEDETLRAVYELMKWGPTSANGSPARFLFLRSREAKERMRPALAPGNVEKTMMAPVTVIVAYDLEFYEKLDRLAPHSPAMAKHFADTPGLAEATARRNSSLQGAYLMIAARALGLDCGPMSGFDNARVDEIFFSSGDVFPGGNVKSNFLCNLGYGDPARLRPRAPRLEFSEACAML